MTISSAIRKAGPYSGNDVATSFAFAFKVFDKEDIAVTLTTAAGVESTLVLDSDYSVAVNADQVASPGGTVTYPMVGVALATGKKLTITSALEVTQPTDITNGGGFYPEVIESALDRLTMLIGQQAEELSRAAKINLGSAASVDDLVANINTVAGIASSTSTVAGIAANVTTVAGVAADVTTVAGISGNVTAVAGSVAAVGTAATNIAAIIAAPAAATTATTQAGISTTKAGESLASANAAAAAQVLAEAALASTLAAYDSFDDRYLGAKAADPTVDNDGNALVASALYFDTTAPGTMKVYTGSAWVAAYVSGSGYLAAANNLSDVASAATARANLGLAIGTNVQAYDADLSALAALASAADKLPYSTGAQAWALTAFTAAARTLIAAVDAAAQRTAMGAAASGANNDINSLAALTTPITLAQGGNGIQSITATVAANALTVGLAATSLQFRSATLTSGTVNTRAVSAISLVVPSSATLGTVSGQQSRLVLLAIDNAGTVEPAIVNIAGGTNLDETGVISTTAISAAATSASVVYSTTARSSVPYRVVGYVESTQATAGTWATAPSTIQGQGGEAIAAMSSSGFGQSRQDVASSRAIATTYYNTTGRSIDVEVTLAASTGFNTPSSTVGGVISYGSVAASGQGSGYLSFRVPPGKAYSVNMTNFSSITAWTEVR